MTTSTDSRPLLVQSIRPALLVLVALAGLVIAPAPAAGQESPVGEPGAVTWGIRPSSPTGPDGRDHFDLELDPGATIEDHVGVSNFTEAPLELAVYATDAFTTAGGTFDLLPEAEEPVDAGAWVAFAEETVVVPPRSRLDIPFHLAVPDDATPGDHAAGIVASLRTTTTDAAGNPLTVDRRVAARIYLRVAGAVEPAATITAVELDHGASGFGGDATVTYTVANTGNLRLGGTPAIVIEGPFGLGRRRTDGPPIPELLPGHGLTFTTTVEDVPPLGRLRATVELTAAGIGDDAPFPTVAGTASTWAVPWFHLGLAAALVGAAGLVVRRQRQCRRRLADQLAAARAEGRAEVLAVATVEEQHGDG